MHIITGEIRKEPRVKQMPNGSTLYVVELSERYKDKDGNWQYTNYSFFFNAKTEGLKGWYDEAFQVGKVISLSCDTLRIETREYNGKMYSSLMPGGFANLIFSQRGESQQQYQQRTQGGWGQQQQNQPQQPQQPRQSNQPPMDFDDDIPF
ncbi:single strand DNA binding protein [Escherichia phage herni]|uniref:Single-stranded DNA binding protein n=1 Tax=Escherichia phage herni TaxID=2696404 RepID=A0A6B9XDJ7_9CAUD|nr:single strand DNA binding protein [Escherichia phage herni]QHR74814.1 single-stranded DNA binding protein [Escherichia phage herni]